MGSGVPSDPSPSLSGPDTGNAGQGSPRGRGCVDERFELDQLACRLAASRWAQAAVRAPVPV